MNTETASATDRPDTAAVFACALSLWQACEKCARNERLNLSKCYDGMDELMRVVMRVGDKFEAWACSHISFNEFNDVWPYLLEDKFGDACLTTLLPTALAEFEDSDCLRIALHLQLPVIAHDQLPIPINVSASNTTSGSPFRGFRIQTVRNFNEDNEVVPFVAGDEPFDEEFGEPYFGLYGIGADETLEHIADRKTYAEALSLVRKLAPGIEFPDKPVFGVRR